MQRLDGWLAFLDAYYCTPILHTPMLFCKFPHFTAIEPPVHFRYHGNVAYSSLVHFWEGLEDTATILQVKATFGSIFSNHQHFTVTTGICGITCPLSPSGVDKPLI